ncbi:hypothetical protein NQ314_001882 [Rhamnusium bicolor]|uniref:Uncharacterized protein n=1 Tax=Rhamnusium bicolor TaxID=1586634 RepID=A0AAV8ZT00_9CUCU|nr:hypothetical protein NQ314_001882 [Rhamnusium bicolor]
MRAYLERAQEHDQFMKKQKEEFQIGKRHLANMMGENPETFTQEDIDEIVQHINDLYKFEDAMIRKGLKPDPNLALELSGYQWIDKESLEKNILEIIGDRDYNNLINALERLCSLPYSYKSRDFIMQYRRPLMNQMQNFDAPKPQYDKDGRAFIATYECRRKRAIGNVTVRMPGTGKITINDQDITYFTEIQPREQVC